MISSTVRYINPEKEYKKNMQKALENSLEITISQEQCSLIKNFGVKWSDNKLDDVGLHYTADSNQIKSRSTRGYLGEAALENFLGMKFSDLDPMFSYSKNIPDLEPIGLRYGVKTNRPSNPFIIFKNSPYPEILITQSESSELKYHVLGLFPPSLLNHPDFTCDSLIYDDELKRRGTKTGFFGVHLGKQFKTYDDLLMYAGDKWIVKDVIVGW